MNTHVCSVSFYYAETPLASIKQQLTTITHKTFRTLIPLYAFVGKPFTKQLFVYVQEESLLKCF